ncbi:acyl-CoA thioesterase FadM [Pseudomonas duriflava]|uniref:Acyl-CoA thioesterase FadM n=1 Tax=Pseudomonas duriflava TaxID=459528 RepID=A0A562Q8F3_9PSED|nr:thioesterase family protein [Pseudomonas duriflava]TWI53037.1 acyl-CoA thioesterase FadM [Pseudomonas duriflava]
MARIELNLPSDQFYFTTYQTVRSTDINAGGHLSNESMISMISEARTRFMFYYGIRDGSEDGIGTMVTDLATVYLAEAFARDKLQFDIGVMDFNKYGGDMIFRITRPDTDTLIALAKCGFVFYNYREKHIEPMPKPFHRTFPKVNWVSDQPSSGMQNLTPIREGSHG